MKVGRCSAWVSVAALLLPTSAEDSTTSGCEVVDAWFESAMLSVKFNSECPPSAACADAQFVKSLEAVQEELEACAAAVAAGATASQGLDRYRLCRADVTGTVSVKACGGKVLAYAQSARLREYTQAYGGFRFATDIVMDRELDDPAAVTAGYLLDTASCPDTVADLGSFEQLETAPTVSGKVISLNPADYKKVAKGIALNVADTGVRRFQLRLFKLGIKVDPNNAKAFASSYLDQLEPDTPSSHAPRRLALAGGGAAALALASLLALLSSS